MRNRKTTYLSYTDIRRKRRRRMACACIAVAAASVIAAVGVGVFFLRQDGGEDKPSQSKWDISLARDEEPEPGGTGSQPAGQADPSPEPDGTGSQSAGQGEPSPEPDGTGAQPADQGEPSPEPGGTDAQPADPGEPEDSWGSYALREDRVKVKGIYVTGPMAGSSGMNRLIELIDNTELNAVVIDVKNDEGNITYSMDLPAAQEMGACIRYIRDMEGLMAKLKEHNIYTIARIVCFKEPRLAEHRPELALKNANGTNLTDGYGLAWVNPYREEVWEYLTDIALAAADMGFDEIQYDYVRFPVGKGTETANYGVDIKEYPKEQAIADFLNYAAERLHEKGVPVTADVFGTIIESDVDARQVGQNYEGLGGIADVLCPMIYPSHYKNGVFGLPVPDAYPYESVKAALQHSQEKLSAVDEKKRAVVRPWLQAFTATWVEGHISYGGEEIRKQIQAVYDAGYEEWILWNAANRYREDGLEKTE